MSNFNTRWGMVIATVALGIKLSKNWYIQQKENLEIIKIKSRAEMQFEKARIHPELLLRSLDTIYSNIQSGCDKASSLILNLSEVLSYSLYENENVMVPLKKELVQLQHLITLEQEKKESSMHIEMWTKADMENKYIAPMVLVKIAEQTISHLYKAKIFSCFAQLNLIAENNMIFFTLSISNGEENKVSDINWDSFIANTQNRLNAYYTSHDFNFELFKHGNEIIIEFQLKLLEYAEEKVSIPNIQGISL